MELSKDEIKNIIKELEELDEMYRYNLEEGLICAIENEDAGDRI